MLILTSAACPDPRAIDAPRAWPGPIVFAALPGHGLRRAALRAIEEDAVVMDCLEPPVGLCALLGEVAARVPGLLREDDGPLLVEDAPVDGPTLRKRRARGVERPRAITPRWSPEERLVSLLIGAGLAGHPLAADALALTVGQGRSDREVLRFVSVALEAESYV